MKRETSEEAGGAEKKGEQGIFILTSSDKLNLGILPNVTIKGTPCQNITEMSIAFTTLTRVR